MSRSFTSPPTVLNYYLCILHNAEVRQIKTLAEWADRGFSRSFRNLLVDQQQQALQQRDALKQIESNLGTVLSGITCHPVQSLLFEAEKVILCAEDNAGSSELIVTQLLYCVKHYKIVTYQAALDTAQQLKEQKIADALSEIIVQKEQAYLLLGNLLMNHRQNGKLVSAER